MNRMAKTMLMGSAGQRNRESGRNGQGRYDSGDYRENGREYGGGEGRQRDGYGGQERGGNSRYREDYQRDYMGRNGRQGRDYDDYGGYNRDMGRESYGGYSRREGRENQSRGMRIEGRAGRGEDGDYYASGYLMAEEEPEKLTRETAKKWLDHMENEDGTKGPHWNFEQANQLREQKKIDCDPVEFWVALNMMFSDYSAAAKKSNASTVDFYVDMAKAFLCDKDAKPDKLERYYQAVVKH